MSKSLRCLYLVATFALLGCLAATEASAAEPGGGKLLREGAVTLDFRRAARMDREAQVRMASSALTAKNSALIQREWAPNLTEKGQS